MTSQLQEMRKNTIHKKSFSFRNKIVVARAGNILTTPDFTFA